MNLRRIMWTKSMKAAKLRSGRRVRFWMCLWCLLLMFYCVTHWIGLIRWSVPSLPPNHYSESSVYLQVRNSDTYLYSAIVNMAPAGAPDISSSGGGGSDSDATVESLGIRVEESYGYIVEQLHMDPEIVITGLDRSRSWAGSFACCVISGRDQQDVSYASPASTYFEHVKPFSWTSWIKEYWLSYTPSVYVATQYSCRIPRSRIASATNMPTFATLAPMPSLVARTLSPFLFLAWPWLSYESYCPKSSSDYLTVEYPRKAPQDLGLCSKINHNGGGSGNNGPDPDTVLEWFELQRHLGVDRVVVYDMGDNSAELNSIFMHYQKSGLLDLQPYDLPGEPRERSLGEDLKRTPQFNQDETLAVLECRLRVSGHGLVLSMDKDEVLVPRQDVSLKELLKNLFSEHPSAASLVFPTQFFITTWPASHPEESLQVLRFRRTRLVRWECWKYAFLPSRVKAAITHEVFPTRSYSPGARISHEKAILHHYRACPRDTWGTCGVSTTLDNTMTRYREVLTSRVSQAKAQVLALRQSMGEDEEAGDEDRR